MGNKLKVFIVEDELLIRDTLRNLLVKFEEEYQVIYAGEASDGEIALSMIQEIKPDILLTDIKMPFMDGLTLAKYAKELFPWIHVVIISGFQDFNYLQESISIGVEGYLTKPIHPDDLSEVIDRIKKNRAKKLLEQSAPKQQEKMINFEYYKEHFINKLLHGKYSADELFEREEDLNFIFMGKSFTVLSVKLTPVSQQKSFYHQLITLFSDLFQEDKQVFLTILDDFTMTGIISGNSVKDSVNKAYYVADIIQYELQKNAIQDFLIGIGSSTNRLSELVSILQATISKVMLQPYSDHHIVEITMNSKPIKNAQKKLKKMLEKDTLDLQEILDQIEKELSFEKNESPTIYKSILDTLLSYIKQLDEEAYFTVSQEYTANQLEMISQTAPLFKLTARLLLEEINKIKVNRKKKTNWTRADGIIEQCIAYLEKNFDDPNISLQSMAERLKISPAYLSTIFSQNKNITFIECLTAIRMDHAAILLETTSKKIIDITFEVGYNDPNYFSFTFKKRTGLTPKEFRKKLQLSGG